MKSETLQVGWEILGEILNMSIKCFILRCVYVSTFVYKNKCEYG